MNKKLIFIIILLSAVSIALSAQAIRDLEIRYPDFGDITMDVQTVDVFLPNYIRYIFQFMVIISGFVAFGTLIYAGVKLVSSAGNPSVRKDSTEQISAAILGIAIIFGSYLISKTINPMLVNTIPGIDAIGGITVYSSYDCSVGGEQGGKKLTLSSNILDIESGHKFKALSFKFNSAPGDLDVILFSEANYKGDSVRISSGQDSLASQLNPMSDEDCHIMSYHPQVYAGVNSIKFRWQMPGIYLCSQQYIEEGGTEDEPGEFVCGGAEATDSIEKLVPYDTELLSVGLDNNVGGLRLKQNKKIMAELGPYSTEKYFLQCTENYNGVYGREGDYAVCYLEHYGVILHEDAGQTGAAEVISPMMPPPGPYEYEGDYEDYERDFLDFIKDLDGINPFTGKDTGASSGGGRCSFTCELEGGVPCDNAIYCQGSCIPDINPDLGINECCCFAGDNRLNKTSSITTFSPRENDEAGGVYLCEEPDPRRTKEPECRGPFQYAMGNFGEDESPFYNINDAANCAEEWITSDGISSIIIDGNYLVVLFDEKNFGGLAQAFKYSNSNLIDDPIGSCCQVVGPWGRSDCASSAIILPIKGGESTGGWVPPTLMETCGDYSAERCADNDNECFYCGGVCHERNADGSVNCSLCSQGQYGTKDSCETFSDCYWCEQGAGFLGECFNKPVDCSKCDADEDGCKSLSECHYCIFASTDKCYPIADECIMSGCLAHGDDSTECRTDTNCYWCDNECKEKPIECSFCDEQECAEYQDNECFWQPTPQICTSEEKWRPQSGDPCEPREAPGIPGSKVAPAFCLEEYAGYNEREYLKCIEKPQYSNNFEWSELRECDESETCDDNEVMITDPDYPCF